MGPGPGHRCCCKQKIRRGLWSAEEDEKLIRFITTHGHKSWSSVPKLAGLQRCGKSCRLRWINYLRPDLKRGSFTPDEEWAQIAKHLPGRTDNEVKKKLISHGLNPQTHTLLSSSSSSSSHKTATSASCNISVSPIIQLNPNSINFIPMQASSTTFSSLGPNAQPQLNIVQTASTMLSNYSYDQEISDFPYESSSGNTPMISSSCISPSGVGLLSDNFGAQTWDEAEEAQAVQQEKGIVEAEREAKGNPEINVSFERSNFDFGLLESVLTSEFMSHNFNMMDELAWNF